MYIKILVYIIDNQQFKLKISILFFRIAGYFPLPFAALRGLGGRGQKRQHGRADFGEVVRPAYPPPIIPHLILPITSRISSSPNIPHTSSQPYHLPSHLICYICDIIKT